MNNNKVILYYQKNGTIYRMKEGKHSYTLAFINTFWEQLINDYKKILDKNKIILFEHILNTYVIDKIEWDKITKELQYDGKVIRIKQGKSITIYVENPNAPLCHFVCKDNSC